ncbi:uncharacterized protein LOC130935999 isoform X1 [Arachis stenosperma]|uniref:uncharacterized protein LOC130935999 isoform X1 n=1 Tax=Arachis stenosperma TaxID=217475 RepID=UPI0025AC17AF|nr:uncharacterized protein LOC130935999 isoform X1 [Arachis stenosperma]
MCDKGGKSCPICTEEMDLTDQQLKPCKCGYEICVWCWHHIMEMSEKDGTGGRCPACRVPYDKERIVAMAANCQRLVAEMNSKHRKKMQKLKSKSTEGRKHLTDVRVIQRNLVYIIGLALNLADEDLLQRKEYFGRYGKVMKVSISRTASGIIQHSANNSCCVYITYSKEAEAIRCIQSVHCFVLEGRPLRACFGTTKYCHAWLRNVPCSNRDCLYLHDYGSQEDSFTKDELVLAFARSRVQQIIGATNNLHRRSGCVLPPTEDDPRHMSSTSKLISKSSLDKIENQIKASCSGSGTMTSPAPPAVTSWVMRVSGSLPPDTNSSFPGQSAEAGKNPEVHSGGMFVPTEMDKHHNSGNSQKSFVDSDQDMVPSAANSGFLNLSKSQCDFNIDKSVGLDSNRDVEGLCSDLSSISLNNHVEDPYSVPDSDRLLYMHGSNNSSLGKHLQQDNEYPEEHSTTPAFWEDVVDDVLNLDYEQSKFSKGVNHLSTGICSPYLHKNAGRSSHHLWQQDQNCHEHDLGKPSESFNDALQTGFEEHVGDKENVNKVTSDMGESSIISNILSLDLDAWEDSLVKLLEENEEPSKALKSPNLWRSQDKNQSRFSFARQDALVDDSSDLDQLIGITRHVSRGNVESDALMENKDMWRYSNNTVNGKHPCSVPSINYALPDKFLGMSKAHASSPPGFSLSSRVPPGFSGGGVEYNSSIHGKHLSQQHVLASGDIGKVGDVQFNDLALLEIGKGMLTERVNNASLDMMRTSFPQFSPGEDDPRLKMLMHQSAPLQNLNVTDHAGNIFSPQNDAYRISSRFLDQFPANNPSIYEQIHSQQFSNNGLSSNSQWGGWHDARNFNDLPMPQVLNNERKRFNNSMPSY